LAGTGRVTDRRTITPAEFRAAVRTRGMTMESFARDYGKHPVSVYRWGKRTNGKGVLPFPVWVVRLVESWQEPAERVKPVPSMVEARAARNPQPPRFGTPEYWHEARERDSMVAAEEVREADGYGLAPYEIVNND
jgi:hypothetical protein